MVSSAAFVLPAFFLFDRPTAVISATKVTAITYSLRNIIFEVAVYREARTETSIAVAGKRSN
jgi:hypothetical protein